jgi:glycosyltransferase involved in cell wall biosynthesis
MKVGIYDLYLDTAGGGERYCLTLAETLLKNGWEVDIFWPTKEILPRLQSKFRLEIEKANFVNYSLRQRSIIQRRRFEKDYDLLFYVSDGSLPFMFGKKNWLHFQVPFKKVLQADVVSKLKIKKIDKIICNSLFTKKVIDARLKVDSLVVYPPVDIAPLKPQKKENLILSVGRFSQLLQGKKQDVLVNAFKKIIDKKTLPGWKLILAGGSEVGGKDFVNELKEMSRGYPIEIKENLSFGELLRIYGKAKIFWTASGYGIDEVTEPEKVEHFGITTVEAMAAGAVPIVSNKGGQKEIVTQDENGYLWLEEEELIDFTLAAAHDSKKMTRLVENAMLRSKAFSKEKFAESILNLLCQA